MCNLTPPNVNCDAGCPQIQENYLHGALVTLSAQAAADADFAGWVGACAGANPNAVCQLTMDASKVTTATFNLQRHLLRLTKNGSGNVNLNPPNVDCGAGCAVREETYDHGTVVTLTAQADTGFSFTGWGEACAGFAANPVCVLTMDVAKNATANFTVRSFQLSVGKCLRQAAC